MIADVDGRDFERGWREVDRVDGGVGKVVRQQDRETAGSRAYVDDVADLSGVAQEAVELPGDYFQKIGARYDGAFVDVEAMFAEKRFSRDVGGGHAFDRAPGEDFAKGNPLFRAEWLVEHGRFAVERKVESVEKQVQRLVVRRGSHLTERKFCAGVHLFGKGEPGA